MYQRLHFSINGISPLMLHNGRLSNPLDEFAKQIKTFTAKRKKTDSDHLEISRLEFLGGLYVDEQQRPVIPGENIEAAFIESAKKLKLGQQSKAAIISDGLWPIEYDGPKKPDALWEIKTFVDVRRAVVGTSSVQRTRPIFRKWSLAFDLDYLPDQLNEAQVVEIVNIMGRVIGVCDYTPKYGRFTVESVKAVKMAA